MSIAIPDSMITINGASVSTTTAAKLLLCSPLYISCITTANAATTANGKNDYFGLGLLKFLLVTVIPGVVCIIIVGTIIYCCCFRKKTPDESVEMNMVAILPEVEPKVDPEIVITVDGPGASLSEQVTASSAQVTLPSTSEKDTDNASADEPAEDDDEDSERQSDELSEDGDDDLL